jgi:hypothetical protein
MKNIFVITLFFILTIGRFYSQTICCPYINSITIVPASPTTDDTIKIVTRTTTPSLGSKISFTYTQQSDTFDLVGCFWEGTATAPSTFLDTTDIGMLTAGTYFVDYLAYSSVTPAMCSVIDTNSMTTSFQVNAASGIGNLNLDDNLFSIYPNPFSVQTILQTNIFLHNATFKVSNYLGQTVKQINNISGQTVTLLRENLPIGLHFLQLIQGNQVIATKKIIITD